MAGFNMKHALGHSELLPELHQKLQAGVADAKDLETLHQVLEDHTAAHGFDLRGLQFPKFPAKPQPSPDEYIKGNKVLEAETWLISWDESDVLQRPPFRL